MFDWFGELTREAPMAAVAAMAIYVIYQMSVRWVDERKELNCQVLLVLGEVKECLREVADYLRVRNSNYDG